MAVQVTMYLNEADEWQHLPLHMELLNYLRRENVAGATVLHAVGDSPDGNGFTPHPWWTLGDICRWC